MVVLLLAGVVGLCIGFSLGVLATAILVASRNDALPTPTACAYPRGACLLASRPGHAF
jgi:predicted lysophospholipase L1 biosynthesis ABC-type transport system permease subunit